MEDYLPISYWIAEFEAKGDGAMARRFAEWQAAAGDLPMVLYTDDGTDSPDEWVDGPHLGVQIDGDWLAWPVHVEGWANPAVVGWNRVRELCASGERE